MAGAGEEEVSGRVKEGGGEEGGRGRGRKRLVNKKKWRRRKLENGGGKG